MFQTSGTIYRHAHAERHHHAVLNELRAECETQQQKRGVESVCGLGRDRFPIFPQEQKKEEEIRALLTIFQLPHVNPFAAAALKKEKQKPKFVSHTIIPSSYWRVMRISVPKNEVTIY